MAVHGTQWELSEWGNGEICLVYWDSLHGRDEKIVLNPNGTASLHSYAYPDFDDEPIDVYTPIDLVQWLRERASR